MKKIKNWYAKRNEQGSSLLEVIVAVVILAVVGSTLLGGLNSANLAQRKTAQVAFAENQMQMGNDALALANFVACNSGLTNPYTDVSLPNNVTILSVAVLDPATSATSACSTIAPNSAAQGAETVEQIKIQYTNAVTGITRTRTVLKYLQALTTNLSTDCKAVGYKINALSPSTMQLVAGDSTILSTPVSTTCDSYGTDTVWDSATLTGLNGATGLAANVDAQSLINLSSVNTGTPGTITVRINGHDSLTGTAAINAQMTVGLLPKISLQSGTTTTWTALQGCGIMPPAQDQPSSNYCSTYNSTTSNKTRALVLTGGSRSNPSTWVTVASSSTQPWKITPSGTTGSLTYDATQTAFSGPTVLPFTATGGALFNNVTFGSINLVVRPTLSFGSPTVTTAQCANKNFKATTSSNKCSITLTSLPGTGYVAASGSQYAASIAGGSKANVSTGGDSKVTYTSATDTYSKAITFYYKSGTGNLCAASSTGASDSATIAVVTDVVTGTTISVVVTVTC